MSQLLDFAAIELRYHLRRPVNHAFIAGIFFAGFVYTCTASSGGGIGGALHVNAPYRLAGGINLMSLIGTIIVSAIAGTAILRDFEIRCHELLFTTHLRKPAFVLGRYLGATLFTFLVLASSVVGLWVGTKMPWLDPAHLGPHVPGMYLLPTLIMMLPNALFISALFFAVGILTRSFVAVYVQGIALFVGWQIGVTTLVESGWQRDIHGEFRMAMLDPFGILATGSVTRYWSVEEQNTQLIGLVGPLLYNRLLWLGIGALLLLVAYRRFDMAAFAGGRRRAATGEPEAPPRPRTPPPLPRVTPRHDRAAGLAGLLALTRLYFRDIVRARAFTAVVAIGLLFLLSAASVAHQQWGTDIYPLTWAVINVLGLFNLFFFILIALYAGELVWRERGLRCDQLHDATPVSSVHTLAAKIVAVLLVIAVVLLALGGFGVLFQTYQGYTRYELDVYFTFLYGFEFAQLALWVLLGFALQIFCNNKYLGVVVFVAADVILGVLPKLGVEHRLLRYCAVPEIEHSSMNGFGMNVGMFVWLFAYYVAFAAVLLTFARLFLVRGTPDGLRARLHLARSRISRRWLACLGGAAVAWLGLGAWAYYNMHVLNLYADERGIDDRFAEYERELKRHEALPQPRIAAATVHVDLYPEAGGARARGSYRLHNPYDEAIDTVLVQTERDHILHALAFAGDAALVHEFFPLRVQLWRLAAPLAPGSDTTLTFDIEYVSRAQERRQEQPLARNDNQPYIHYAKGVLAFYRLKDVLGEDVVNAALARMLREHAYHDWPYPSADDLVAILRDVTPPEYQYLITDLFETITLHDNKVGEASAAEENGKFRVRFAVSARKFRADGLGKETTVPLADHIDVGVFAAPQPDEYLLGKPLFMERRVLTATASDDPTLEQVIEVVVDERPYRVGIDPYNKLLDRDPDDNTTPL